MALDPVVEQYVKQMAALNLPSLASIGAVTAREMDVAASRQRAAGQDLVAVAAVADRTIPGPTRDIRLRVYTPAGQRPFAALLFFHGGGWVIGGLDQYDDVCRRLTNAAGAVVVSVDYGLAPEHKFPAPVEDCYTATEYVALHSDEFGVDGSAIAVGGDSAGGNLAAAVCLLARERQNFHIAFQLLIYPATDMSADTLSKRDFSSGYVLDEETMRWFGEAYLRGPEDVSHPLASPALAASHVGLPPALVMTAAYDPLRDEGRLYAEKLAAAGVPVTYREYPGMIHGFILFVPFVKTAIEALDDAGAALGNALNTILNRG